MIKKIVSVLFLLGGSSFAFAESQNVPLHIIKESSVDELSTKAPARPWYITQDDNILTLPATPVDYELQLIDEMGNLIYSEFIPAGTTQIVVPSDLTGEFEIRLVSDTYYYKGYISL